MPEFSIADKKQRLLFKLKKFYPENSSARKLGRLIVHDLAVYQNGRWKARDCEAGMPYEYKDTKYEYLYQFLRESNGDILSSERIRKILKDSQCQKGNVPHKWANFSSSMTHPDSYSMKLEDEEYALKLDGVVMPFRYVDVFIRAGLLESEDATDTESLKALIADLVSSKVEQLNG